MLSLNVRAVTMIDRIDKLITNLDRPDRFL